MTYSDEEIRRRLRLGEDSAWAFKRVEFSGDRPTSPRRDDWANEVVAFANGREIFVRNVDIVGRSALVEYRPVDGTGGAA
ncbi:MAG: hypothetical protein OXK78_18460 [Caldilineaceae bacterium]|nr:hypothetical protein [Caldilineaceae bacterium]